MIDSSLRKQAFWLYGVIVGLAIKEAITGVIPHLYNTPSDQLAAHLPEVWRLMLFLLLAIRFYFGATIYFDAAYEKLDYYNYENEEYESRYKNKNFGLDFLAGFVHFILFSALALSIPIHAEHGKFLFLILLGCILLYDVVWVLFNIRKDTIRLTIVWTMLNIITCFFAFLCWAATCIIYVLNGFDCNFYLAEGIAFLPVILFSVLDLSELMFGRPVISSTILMMGTWLQNVAAKDEPQEPPPPPQKPSNSN